MILQSQSMLPTMFSPGSYHLAFANDFERESVRLIEIPQSMIDDVLTGQETLLIRGEPQCNAVVVNNKKTFRVNLVETTNTSLLLKQLPCNGANWEVQAAPTCHYELVETVPDVSMIAKLLDVNTLNMSRINCLTDNDDKDDQCPKGVSLDDLRDRVQASDAEITNELILRKAIEHNGRWFGLEVGLINSLLTEILDVALAGAMSMDRLRCSEIVSELSETFPESLIMHVLTIFSDTGCDDHRSVALNQRAVCRQIAVRIFLEQPKIPVESFMQKWQLELPSLMQPDLRFLQGIAFQDDSVFTPNLCYVPIERLPSDPKARFEFLFGIRRKWPYEELVPFIDDIVSRGYALETLMMRFTKSIQKGQYYIAKHVYRR